MAYSFGLGNTDKISMGTTIGKSVPFSIFARVKVNTVTNLVPRRFIASYNDGGSQSFFYLFFLEDPSFNNQLAFGFSKSSGTSFPTVKWTSGFTAGSIHTVVGVYTGSALNLYADTDSSAKTTTAESGTPDQPSQTFLVGNSGGSESWDGTVYEIGWWPGTALTGAQAANLGAAN